jgi:adenylate cyclase class 2
MSPSDPPPEGLDSTTFEVEMKYRVEDPTGLRQRIDGLRPRWLGAEDQADVYLVHPARDFATSNEALRVRRSGRKQCITYKGPKQGGPTKTREEIEIEFEPGEEAFTRLLQMWTALGFRPLATVRKRRTSYELTTDGRKVLVVVDEAEALGTFAEVETLARGQADVAGAQGAVQSTAARLGLDPNAYEPRSYLRMLLEFGKSAGPD